jgi:hypothetical protein
MTAPAIPDDDDDIIVATVEGWYPDPMDKGSERWWNGSAWTEHRRGGAVPVAAVPAAPAVPASPYGVGLPMGGVPGAPVAGGYYGPPSAQQRNGIAVTGMILAIVAVALVPLGASFFGIILGIVGGVLSVVGLRRARALKAAGDEHHRGRIALIGVILGFAGALFALLWTIAFLRDFLGL